MNKKLQLLLVALFMVLATFSQTQIDGFQYVLGDKGIDTATGEEYSVAEQINPVTYTVVGYTDIEINEMYPDFISATPNRGSSTTLNRHVDSDAGDWSPSGIHPGEDWNIGAAGDDTGLPVYATANGVVYDFRPLSVPITKSGWCMIIEHTMPDESKVYSFYMHITTSANTTGTMCANETDFGFDIGEEITRGQMIARIGDVTSFGDHLHFEIRDSYNMALDLWPNGPGGRYPESSAAYATSISMEKVAQAYFEMQLDGILDASDFIDAHRPSLYAEPAPEIEWENTIGGSDYEQLNEISQTNDGGYILGGWSSSNISGDKTENNLGVADYWIVKTDLLGIIEWENTIGGNGEDNLTSLQQTSDGGYILGGYSYSDINVDKTEDAIGDFTSDYWIIKLNHSGNIEWQNTIGGNGFDELTVVRQTLDGGYILGGYSDSDISSDKTEASVSLTLDYWIVKTDSIGDIEWQNTVGSNSDDLLTSIEQTNDGGYIVGGYTKGGISGDKTEANLGLPDHNDYWVVKLDNFGNVVWENTIGGTQDDNLRSIIQTSDSGYFIGGYSNSGISGDKTESGPGDYDYWVLKLDNTGDIDWQNTIGGSGVDYLYEVDKTFDGGYIVGGESLSGISGDKTEGSTNGDYWVIKLNDTGNIEWENTLGGSSGDNLTSLQQTSDGGYILGGYSGSGISGDKTESAMGVADYWIVKLAGNCSPATEICNSIDDDCDGLIDNAVVETISISASGPTTFCQGGSVVLTATYTGTSIQWKKDDVYIGGATNSTYTATTSGNYTAVSTSPCGSVTSSGINVIANKNPTATITAGGPTTFCSGGSVVLTANAGGGLSYQWYKGATAIAGATSINYTATTTGNYKCRVTKTATGCFKNSNAITVSVTCKSDVDGFENISIYPNPASNNIIINFDEVTPNTYIVILNSIGQITLKEFIITESTELNVSTLATGLYTINLLQNGNIIHSEKIIIE